MSDREEVLFATVRVDEDNFRHGFWLRMFGWFHVPILEEEPAEVTFPDGTTELCYMVDLEKPSSDGRSIGERMIAEAATMKTHPSILAGMKAGIYPIDAKGVTVIRARRGFVVPRVPGG